MSIFHVDDKNVIHEWQYFHPFPRNNNPPLMNQGIAAPTGHHKQRLLYQKHLSNKIFPWLNASVKHAPLWIHVENEANTMNQECINLTEINHIHDLVYSMLIQAKYPKNVTIVTAYPQHAKTMLHIFEHNRILSREMIKNRIHIMTADLYSHLDSHEKGLLIFSMAIAPAFTALNNRYLTSFAIIQKSMSANISLIVTGHQALLENLSEVSALTSLSEQLRNNIILLCIKPDYVVTQTALLSQHQLDCLQQRLFMPLKEHQIPITPGVDHQPSLIVVRNGYRLNIYIQHDQTYRPGNTAFSVSAANQNIHTIHLRKKDIEENLTNCVATIVYWHHNTAN